MDVPLSILFKNNYIFLGYKDGYLSVDIATAVFRKFPCTLKSSSIPFMAYTIHDALLVNQDNNILFHLDAAVVVLHQLTFGSLFDHRVQACSSQSFTMDRPSSSDLYRRSPEESFIDQSRPFLITLEDNHIDIHGMYDQKCIQTVYKPLCVHIQ